MVSKLPPLKISKIPRKPLFITSIIFAFLLILLGLLAYGLAYRTRTSMLESRELKYSPPTTPMKTQVRRVLLKREGENGIEYIEVLMDGTINLYDANMKLIKSGIQGYGRVNSLLDDLAKNFNHLDSYLNGNRAFTITIETNHGTYTYTGGGNGGGNNTLDDIVDNIDDLADNTFTPTPTPRPTYTPPIRPPTPTLTPNPYFSPTPLPYFTPNPLTPTPLPGYMTAPPFQCEDYRFSRPTTISNIICVPTTAP